MVPQGPGAGGVSGTSLSAYFRRVDGLRATVGGGHKAPLLKLHLAEMGLDADDVVLIGDSVDDADAAASVGAGVVLYTGGFTHVDKLRAVGVPVVDSLEDAVTVIRALQPRLDGGEHGGGLHRLGVIKPTEYAYLPTLCR